MEQKFNEEIKRMREYIGTQKQAAELIGVHVNYYARVERGVENPPPRTRKRWMKLMGDKVIEAAKDELEMKQKLNGIIY